MIAAVDRVLAALGLVLAAPLLAVCAVAIRQASPGPVLYPAARVGRHGRPFTMLKLRTMHRLPADTDLAARRVTPRDDPRVFPLGRVLRRLRIDELPQLVNVLRGEMALVGPRPEDPAVVGDHYDALMWESLAVPPGVTGLGCLHYLGVERALPTDPAATAEVYVGEVLPVKIALDLVYVRRRSLGYSLTVQLRTVLALAGLRDAFPARQRRERAQAAAILRERARS